MTLKRFIGGAAAAALLLGGALVGAAAKEAGMDGAVKDELATNGPATDEGAPDATASATDAQPRVTSLAELDEDYEFYPLPPGEGVEETYYACVACHSLRTVTNGGYSHRVWDELLDWMVESQGMMELDPEIREEVLDYLATYIGEDWQG